MKIGLLFSGQGAQSVGMGLNFYENSQAARDLYNRADEILGWNLKEISFSGPESLLTETRICQPALYVKGLAIVEYLKESGELGKPGAALGLSLGELTALASAGVYDFETGLRIVAERGKLMQEACEASDGAMASIIGASTQTVEQMCAEFDLDIANLNCPGQIVISGERDKLEAAVTDAKEYGAKMAVPLKVAGAYHSRLMEPARLRFEEFLKDIPFNKPEIPVFTNTTGGMIEEPEAIKQALVKQVVSTVRWEECMTNAIALGIESFFECGPGGILSGLARRIDRSAKVTRCDELLGMAL